MRIKILMLLGLIIVFSSCKNEKEEQTTEKIEVNNSHAVSQQDIEKLDYIEYAIDDKVANQIKDWTEYHQLQTVINSTKKGDLSYFNDNEKAIKTAFKELKSKIPSAVKSPSISARILVVETKLYKLESLANLATTSKEELLATIKELLVAFSNLNLQMNKKVEFDSINIEKP
ncbi:hypothetical protein [Tamlana sp. I1]|uniref:hypothetical protein n=1 Tax=Tamlana sp. I1 TaxID=2762061 RepID=UPI00188EE640|nr:hypothetical protein [Tamlana sp. I1]